MKSNIKSFMSLLLCLLITLSVFPLSAVAEGENVIYLSDLIPTSWRMYASSSDNPASPYRPSYNTNEAGGPLVIADVTYSKGVRTHPDSSYPADLVYDISGLNCNTFSAVVGKDSVGAADTRVQFVLLGDDTVLATSPTLYGGNNSYEMTADITGYSTLTLRINDGGDGVSGDSAAWGNARIYNNPDKVAATISNVNYLSDLEMTYWKMYGATSDDAAPAFRPSLDSEEDGTPLIIGHKEFAKGLRSHPDGGYDAELHYDVSNLDVNTFSAVVGKDSAGGAGNTQFAICADGVELARSPELANNQCWLLTADITGAQNIVLKIIATADGIGGDSGAFGDAMVYKDAGKAVESEPEPETGVYLSDIDWVSWKMFGGTSEDVSPPYTPSRNCNEAGGTLTINGVQYEKGLRTHPADAYAAELVYDISAYEYTTFSATVGKDSAAVAGYGKVQFFIYGDGVLLAASPLMDVGTDCYLACDVTNVSILKLVLDNAGDGVVHDSGAFGNAVLDNRKVNPGDDHLEQHLAFMIPTASTNGVTADTDSNTVTLVGGEQSATYTYDSMYSYFYTTAKNTGNTQRVLTFKSGDTVVKTVTLKPDTAQTIYIPFVDTLPFTVTADSTEATIVLQEGRFTITKKAEEFNPAPQPVGTAAEKFAAWMSDLSTLPTSFVYEDVKYYGLGGEAFTELSRQTNQTATGRQNVITVKHIPSGVDITLNAVLYPEHDAYEWVMYFTNNTHQNTGVFTELRGAEVYVYGSDPVLSGLTSDSNGGSNYNYYMEYSEAVDKQLYYEANTGKPTFQVFPYYNLSTSDNGGTFISASWGGRYYNNFEPCEANGEQAVRFTAAQLDLSTYLMPGETIRTPLVAFVEYDKDTSQVGISNVWRRWFIDCNMRESMEDLVPTMVTASSSWIYTCMVYADEQSQIDAIEAYLEHGIQLDYWWMDAGWYYGPNESTLDTWTNTGIWKVDTRRFPSAFQLINAYADAHGLEGTILWFEPERSALTAQQIRTVFPEFKDEWLLYDTKFGQNEHGMLNISNPECREWITKIVIDIMETGEIDIYRQDFNWLPAGIWQSYDQVDRIGILENLYIQGYYQYFDSLIEHFPDLIIDTCASGGCRLDLETLRRAVPLHRTDYSVDASDATQAATQALSNWVPFSGQPMNQSMDGGFDSYRIRSTYAPSVTLNWDYRNADQDWPQMAALVEELRMVQQYYYNDYYELLPYNNNDVEWNGWQFIDSQNNEGVIQLFCPQNANELKKTIKLYGLNPDVTYVLTDVDGLNSTIATGRELMENGLTISYGNVRSSSVIFINTKPVEVPEGITTTIWRQMTDIPENAIVVSDLPMGEWKMFQSSSNNPASPYQPSINCNELGKDITISNMVFKKGLRSHPDVDGVAYMNYDISAYSDTYTTFSAYVGKDSTGNTGKIQFAVLVDGKEVAKSDILEFGEYQLLFADVTGGTTLTLKILDGGDTFTSDSAAFGLPLLLKPEQVNEVKAREVDGLIYVAQKAEQVVQAREAYDALPEDAKDLVTRYSDLLSKESDIARKTVIALIGALPETIAVSDETAIQEARAAYDALTDTQKQLVANLDKLEQAETALEAAKKAEADKAAAQAVVDKINALTEADKEAIAAARAAYDALSDDQKALVTNLAKLEALENPAPAITYGDVDGDGQITAVDALEVLKSVVGKVTLTEEQLVKADTDGSGTADATDALNILKKVVGKIDCFPVEKQPVFA